MKLRELLTLLEQVQEIRDDIESTRRREHSDPEIMDRRYAERRRLEGILDELLDTELACTK